MCQHGDHYDTTRRRTPQAHQNNYEAESLQKPHEHSVYQPSRSWIIPHNTNKIHCGPMRPNQKST